MFSTVEAPAATVNTVVDSPVGTLTLWGDGSALSGLWFDGHKRPPVPTGSHRDDDAFAEARGQLAAYFAGELREFDLDLAPHGTEWQLRVWSALREIPYGETRSYRDIAEQVCTPAASRAVGMANGRNPISIIVPCHRVIGADGSLTGYGGGLDRKRSLLALEAGILPLSAVS
jgi:methylated-DNA-[protein]-cysteine S-methyltransferase